MTSPIVKPCPSVDGGHSSLHREQEIECATSAGAMPSGPLIEGRCNPGPGVTLDEVRPSPAKGARLSIRGRLMNAVVKELPAHDFKVRDLSLAEWGRKEIQMAEHEMPGLM